MGGIEYRSCGSDHAPAGVKQKKQWITAKETPHTEDIAKYGALKVYRFVTTGLYYAREKARWVLFEELTYIMTSWKDEDSEVDQSCLRVAWGHEGSDVEEIFLSSVPTCRKRSADSAHADEHNTSVLAEFLSERKEMVLCVTHQVKIRPAGSARHRRGAEARTLKRAINLIDVAAKFCVVFTEQSMGCFSVQPFLGGHNNSLKCIYAIAVLLRRFVETFMSEYVLDGAFLMPDGEDPLNLECHGIKLENILPAASVRKRLLTSRCLRMTSDEFDKINAEGSSGGQEVCLDERDGGGDVDIGPDSMDGVMLM